MAKKTKSNFKIMRFVNGKRKKNWYEDTVRNAVDTASKFGKNETHVLFKKVGNTFKKLKTYSPKTRISGEYKGNSYDSFSLIKRSRKKKR